MKLLKLLTVFLALLLGGSEIFALTVPRSDILLHIVSQCVDPAKANYCSNCMLPRADAGCAGVSKCKKTNEVWALTEQYVAIRDIKMCGCPTDFVHGLAMPRTVVTGVEDGNRQEGIWQFAWDNGAKRIEPESLALVVNPKAQRTQNQLHLHLLRLDEDARNHFAQYKPVYVENLSQIWRVAEKAAKSKGLNDYGVLVARESSDAFLVIVMPSSPEAALTIWSCN